MQTKQKCKRSARALRVFMLLIIGAVLMIITGFIGVYVGYIFQEVKHRPVYIIRTNDRDKNQE